MRILLCPLSFDVDFPAEQVDYVHRIESAVAFDVTRSYEVHLVDIVAAQGLGEIGILDALADIGLFFLTSPSSLTTRLIVRSDGNEKPSFLNSHFIADTPIWAYGDASKCCRVCMMRSLISGLISAGLVLGARECSLNQSAAPVL